jgi:hypothetical protein
VIAPQDKPGKPAEPDPAAAPNASLEDALRPFQEAAAKFLQASFAAQQAVMKQRMHAWLDLQDEVRKTEHEAYQAAMAATRKHVDAMAQPPAGSPEEVNAARAQAQLEYEKEIRQLHADTQAKLTALAQRASGEGGAGAPAGQPFTQQQDAYQAYLADLQQAWASTKALDPQAMNAIAANILFTINAASQGSR